MSNTQAIKEGEEVIILATGEEAIVVGVYQTGEMLIRLMDANGWPTGADELVTADQLERI
jgi:hypothetical protein